jgi:hypothetical protein
MVDGGKGVVNLFVLWVSGHSVQKGWFGGKGLELEGFFVISQEQHKLHGFVYHGGLQLCDLKLSTGLQYWPGNSL